MAISSVTKSRGFGVPGKSKQKVGFINLSGTYTSGGESITAKEFGLRRLTRVTVDLITSNASAEAPIVECSFIIEAGATKGKLKFLNGLTAAELATGKTLAGVSVEFSASGY